MILFLRCALAALTLCFAFFFGETMEQFLFQAVRMIIPIDPGNAVRFNLIHGAILLFPLMIFGVLVSIATVDDQALKKRSQGIVLGMLLGLLAYRLYQVWWILKLGVTAAEDAPNQTEAFTSGQIFFLDRVAPFLILGGSSGLIPAVKEAASNSVFYSTLTSIFIFIWLILTHKLPPGQSHLQSMASFLVTVFTGITLGLIVKKIKES